MMLANVTKFAAIEYRFQTGLLGKPKISAVSSDMLQILALCGIFPVAGPTYVAHSGVIMVGVKGRHVKDLFFMGQESSPIHQHFLISDLPIVPALILNKPIPKSPALV